MTPATLTVVSEHWNRPPGAPGARAPLARTSLGSSLPLGRAPVALWVCAGHCFHIRFLHGFPRVSEWAGPSRGAQSGDGEAATCVPLCLQLPAASALLNRKLPSDAASLLRKSLGA